MNFRLLCWQSLSAGGFADFDGSATGAVGAIPQILLQGWGEVVSNDLSSEF